MYFGGRLAKSTVDVVQRGIQIGTGNQLSLGAINIATWRQAMRTGFLAALLIQCGAVCSDSIMVLIMSLAITVTPLTSPTSPFMIVITVFSSTWMVRLAYCSLQDGIKIARAARHQSAAAAIAEYLRPAMANEEPRGAVSALVARVTRSPFGWAFTINFCNPATLCYLPILAVATDQSLAQHALLPFVGAFIGVELVLGIVMASVATGMNALFRRQPRLHVGFIVTSSLVAAVLFFVVALQFALPLVSLMLQQIARLF